MSEQIKLRGRSAISKFRRQKLIKRVNRKMPRVTDIDARFWYFFDANHFSRADIKVLASGDRPSSELKKRNDVP